MAETWATGGRPAGAAPLPAAEPGAAIEVDRIVSKNGQVHLASRYVMAAEILGGMRVAIRIEETTLMFFKSDTRELLRTRPNPLTWEQARRLRGHGRPGRRHGRPPSRSPCSAVVADFASMLCGGEERPARAGAAFAELLLVQALCHLVSPSGSARAAAW